MTTITLRAIYCQNPYCREVTKTGKPQKVGDIDVEARGADLWCAKCKRITYFRRD